VRSIAPVDGDEDAAEEAAEEKEDDMASDSAAGSTDEGCCLMYVMSDVCDV
jgi:hypothetical protein